MKEKFIDWRPATKTRELLGWIIQILDQYSEAGYKLTLRQLYYQLVAQDLIPNNINEYTKLSSVVSNARLAGIIDWEMIEDRVRTPQRNQHWHDPKDILNAAVYSYYRDRWDEQASYIEVWCEKDAVSNIIYPVCRKWDILFMANRGYSSQTAMHDAFKRFNQKYIEEKELHIIYLGDHDPSGLDMINDITNRLSTFFEGEHGFGLPITIERAALTMEQIKKYNLPENPAKTTDSRYNKYVSQYGNSSWELDALKPEFLSNIININIVKHVDHEIFKEVEELEQDHKDKMREMISKLNI